jgi:hypothetical protein
LYAVASHRRSLLIALLALFSLILIVGDRVTTTPATIALLILAVGIAAIVYLHFANPQPVAAAAIAAGPIAGEEYRAPNGAERTAPQREASSASPEPQPAPPTEGAARAPSITISLELPEGDLKILRQIAILLRETN